MDYLPGKGQGCRRSNKENPKKVEPNKQTEKTEERNPAEYDPEKLAAAYDQSIKNYEEYYQQQKGAAYSPYYFYYLQGYGGVHSQAQWVIEYEQALGEYEKSLHVFKQALADFQTFQQFIAPLEARDREESIKGWREYLETLLEFSKQLTTSLEKSVQALTQGNT
jgi:tetratricopeptide (TPR) repeat protein